MKKILITGASGFVGSFLVEEALKRELDVYAGIRKTSSRKYLQDSRIKIFELDFNQPAQMFADLNKANFDYIIHNAGVTTALKEQTYFKVNTAYTSELIDHINALDKKPLKFLYMSSAASYGAADFTTDKILRDGEIPKPTTAYGKSKLQSEIKIQTDCQVPFNIFRPTGVYGPRDTDIYLVFKNISFRFAPVLGYTKQRLSMVYVKDLAKLIIDAALSDVDNKSYFVSDGQVYGSAEFNDAIAKVLNKKALKVNIPISLIKGIAQISELVSKFTKKPGALTMDKAKILVANSWECDISSLEVDFDFKPEYSLDMALTETAQWYKKEGWL